MQTLMEDYESHKVKRREKLEDNSVSVHFTTCILYVRLDLGQVCICIPKLVYSGCEVREKKKKKKHLFVFLH